MRKTKETDDGIRRLDFSDEFLLDSAEKRYEAGDYMGTLTMAVTSPWAPLSSDSAVGRGGRRGSPA